MAINVTDDDWLEDGSDSSELKREREAREKEFHVIGYRDGVIAGKEAAAQEGFNAGFKKAVLGGVKCGFFRGLASALVGLPDTPKGKLLENVAKKERLLELCEAVRIISSDDALRMFHDGILLDGMMDDPRQHQQDALRLAEARARGMESHSMREKLPSSAMEEREEAIEIRLCLYIEFLGDMDTAILQRTRPILLNRENYRHPSAWREKPSYQCSKSHGTCLLSNNQKRRWVLCMQK